MLLAFTLEIFSPARYEISDDTTQSFALRLRNQFQGDLFAPPEIEDYPGV